MNPKELEHATAEFFSRHGYYVEKIPVSNDETPDFSLTKNNERYILEVKDKDSPLSEIKGRDSYAVAIAPMNRLSGILSKAVNQIDAVDSSHKAFHIALVYCAEPDVDVGTDQLYSTLYGRATLASPDTMKCYNCYFFHESAFFSNRSLDVVFIFSSKQLRFIGVNPYSKRKEDFKKSVLFHDFHKYIFDLNVLGEGEKTLIADCRTPRKQTAETLAYLKSKYKFNRLIEMKEAALQALVPVPPYEMKEAVLQISVPLPL